MEKLTRSTACTEPIWRWKMTPWVIGKCLTRSTTSTSGAPSAGAAGDGAGWAEVVTRSGRGPGEARAALRPEAHLLLGGEVAGVGVAGAARVDQVGPLAVAGSKRWGQRGWKAQPGGTWISDGGAPSMGWRRSTRTSGRGIDSSRPHA